MLKKPETSPLQEDIARWIEVADESTTLRACSGVLKVLWDCVKQFDGDRNIQRKALSILSISYLMSVCQTLAYCAGNQALGIEIRNAHSVHIDAAMADLYSCTMNETTERARATLTL